VGDYLFQIEDRARAETIYTRLKENFLKSDYLDFAYVGLGEIAYGKKDYAKALELFTDALEKIAASMKVKDATIGRAKTLLELGQYDESKKLFEQVAGVREWRGESTAMAIYQIGEVEARRGNLNEAIASYRRVFVAYQKFAPWVAKAYLRSAETFDKLGKRKDAIDSLHEMLRIDKLKEYPEVEEAKKRLEEWGAPAA
jgi:TolA-binding protein